MEMLVSNLWDTLNTVIGHRQQVYIRQRYASVYDIIANYNGDLFQTIYSGSKGEGLSLPGSDIDYMHIMKHVVVNSMQCEGADLIINTRGIKPGFAKLMFGKRNESLEKLGAFHSALTPFENDQCYLSSDKFRDVTVKLLLCCVLNAKPHGPCASSIRYGLEIDSMICIPCKEWPIDANEWLCRHRINNWPSKILVKQIVSQGFLLVPIGNPLSQEKHIEWRISFSLAEKKLVHSMNHTQIICYGLLKLYLKHVINTIEDCKDLLCSYFLKTALFYCIEQEDLLWDKSNLLNCFWACFKRLFVWVRKGFCPSYFIQTNNMFESKIFGRRKERLEEHLFRLYQAGTDTFIQIPKICEIFNKIGPVHLPITEVIEIKFDLELLTLIGNFREARTMDTSKVDDTIRCIRENENTLAFQQMQPVDYVLLKIHLFFCHLRLTQHLYHRILMENRPNSKRFQQLRQLSRYILRNCTGYDICTGLLMYATLHYLFGKYRKVVSVLEHVVTKFKSCVLYLGCSQMLGDLPGYVHLVFRKGYSIKQKLKSALAMPYECITICNFYPAEIQHEVKQHKHELYFVTYIPPEVYAYVLLFLTYQKLGNTEARNQTLDILFESTNTHHFISKYEEPIVYALLDRCVNIATTQVSDIATASV